MITKFLEWSGLKYYLWDRIQVPFSEEDITQIQKRKGLTEYVRYCKLAASKGIFSDRQISARKYRTLLEQGYVWSKVSCGENEGLDCWYNKNTGNTKLLEQLTK